MPKKQSKKAESKTPTFEETMGQLEVIVHALEEGEVGLNESLAQYERGVILLRQCYNLLEGAHRRIEMLSGVDAEGKPIVVALDDTSQSLDQKATNRGRPRFPADGSNRGGASPPDADVDSPGGLF